MPQRLALTVGTLPLCLPPMAARSRLRIDARSQGAKVLADMTGRFKGLFHRDQMTGPVNPMMDAIGNEVRIRS